MSAPLVSIICPFFNAEGFIVEALDSVLAQDCRDFELLLIDDGSIDGSTAIALDYAARFTDRISYLTHDGGANHGVAASRNLGMERANGRFIAFIDSDDAWRPNKLSAQLALLERHPEAGMVCGAVNYWRSWERGSDLIMASGEPVGGISRPPATALRV